MTRSVTAGMLPLWMRAAYPIFWLMTRDDGGKGASKAARSSVWAATAPELDGVTGTFFDRETREAELHATVRDPEHQRLVVELIESVWATGGWRRREAHRPHRKIGVSGP
jgi:hypothetical protein